MIGIVVAAHGNLGGELIRTAEDVIGKIEQCIAVDLHDLAHATERFSAAVREVDSGDGILILTDMFGGTPANLGLAMLSAGQVEVLTGVNLPMLIKLATYRKEKGKDTGKDDGKVSNLHETARLIKYYGQKNISVASEFLNT